MNHESRSSRGHDLKAGNVMPTHPEHHQLAHLFELIDGLDEGTQWALTRELKLTAHTIAKDLEQQL